MLGKWAMNVFVVGLFALIPLGIILAIVYDNPDWLFFTLLSLIIFLAG